MDKFVQLPFLIPPIATTDLPTYTNALLLASVPSDLPPEIAEQVHAIAASASDMVAVAEAADSLSRDQHLSSEQVTRVRAEAHFAFVRSEIDRGVESFSDEDEECRELMTDAIDRFFSSNPRELKRFVNAFRLEYFLWWARRAQTGQEPMSLAALQRWVVFSMKWPQVVRWARRGGGFEWRTKGDKLERCNRLELLEGCAKAGNLEEWLGNDGAGVLQLGVEGAPWLTDDDLFAFLREEPAVSQAVGAMLPAMQTPYPAEPPSEGQRES